MPRLDKAGGVVYANVPANVTFFIALAACVVVWLLLWRTRLGYEIRSFGKSEKASRYAGTVSYTHLDVYKRQAEPEPKLANPSPAPSPLDLMYAYFDAA